MALLTGLMFCGPASSAFAGDAKREIDAAGTYSIKIAGCAKGTGKATSSGDKISITASVKDDDGNEGSFNASDLTVDKKNHFAGTGTLLGQKITLHGRLDAPTPDEPAINAQRIVCTFTTADGQHGRIAGYVPESVGGAAIHKRPPKKEDD